MSRIKGIAKKLGNYIAVQATIAGVTTAMIGASLYLSFSIGDTYDVEWHYVFSGLASPFALVAVLINIGFTSSMFKEQIELQRAAIDKADERQDKEWKRQNESRDEEKIDRNKGFRIALANELASIAGDVAAIVTLECAQEWNEVQARPLTRTRLAREAIRARLYEMDACLIRTFITREGAIERLIEKFIIKFEKSEWLSNTCDEIIIEIYYYIKEIFNDDADAAFKLLHSYGVFFGDLPIEGLSKSTKI